MRKGKVLSMSDPLYNKVEEWVELHPDSDPLNPLEDWDQIFEVWSQVPRELDGTKNAEDPTEEIEDEDGYGTGRYKPKDGYLIYPVSAYIHSGIYLSLGSIRCMFGDSPGPGGRGWDTIPNALLMYTYKEKYESMCGEGTWMMIRKWSEDREHKLIENRPAKDWDEWYDYVESEASALVDTLNLSLEGSCYGYTTHKRVHYTKTYDDGTTVDCWEVEDGDDSCWGYLTDKVEDIDFPKDLPVFADKGCHWLQGKEYEIPEWVIVDQPEGENRPAYLQSYKCKAPSGELERTDWVYDFRSAQVFRSWWQAQSVAQTVIGKDRYDHKRNLLDLDELEKATQSVEEPHEEGQK